MNASDQSFFDEYKPIAIPTSYDANDTWRNKVIYCLSNLGAGTACKVAQKLYEFDSEYSEQELQKHADEILTGLFDKGLIKGSKNNQGELVYNLSKMTETNTGEDTDADQR